MNTSPFRALALAASAACALSVATPAPAQEPVTAEVLKVYALFAKFEANIQEVASLVKLRLAVESNDDLAELTETFGEDQAQVLEYVGVLRGMDLTREQTAALDEFERRWAVVTADARAVIDAETVNDEVRASARAFWDDLDDIDDLIDDKLEEMRERHGADW